MSGKVARVTRSSRSSRRVAARRTARKNSRPARRAAAARPRARGRRGRPSLARTIVSTDSEEIAGGRARPRWRRPVLASAGRRRSRADDAGARPRPGRVERAGRAGRHCDAARADQPWPIARRRASRARSRPRRRSRTPMASSPCSRPPFNPFYVGVVAPNRYLAPAFPGTAHTRRQDVPVSADANGALFLWRTKFLRRTPDAWLPTGKRLPAGGIPELHRLLNRRCRRIRARRCLVLAAGLVRLPWLPVASGHVGVPPRRATSSAKAGASAIARARRETRALCQPSEPLEPQQRIFPVRSSIPHPRCTPWRPRAAARSSAAWGPLGARSWVRRLFARRGGSAPTAAPATSRPPRRCRDRP